MTGSNAISRSGCARSSIHVYPHKNDACRSSNVLWSELHSAIQIGICSSIGRQPRIGVIPCCFWNSHIAFCSDGRVSPTMAWLAFISLTVSPAP